MNKKNCKTENEDSAQWVGLWGEGYAEKFRTIDIGWERRGGCGE